MGFFNPLFFLLYFTVLFSIEIANNNNPISCITAQNKKFIFSDLFIRSSEVLSALKQDNCRSSAFYFPYSRNVLKNIERDLKIYHWVNPTSIEKCMIAHQLEIALRMDFIIESLWAHDRARLFSLNEYRLAFLNAMVKNDKANLLRYSLKINALEKIRFKKFNEKVYITSDGVAFKPVEYPASSQFIIQKFSVDSKDCKIIKFPLPHYFNKEYFSLDYFLSLNKYNFLVIEHSSLTNIQYIHLFDRDNHVVTISAPHCDKIKCEYDKTRKYFYVLNVKPLLRSKAYEITVQRYNFSEMTGKIVDTLLLKPQVLLKQYHLANASNEKSFEFFVDLLDGNAYLDFESEKMWHVFVFYPNASSAMYHVFDQVPSISAIKANSLIHFYQENNLNVEEYNLSTNRWTSISEIPLLNATDVFISLHAKFIILRENENKIFSDYIYDVQSGGFLYNYSFTNLPHTTKFRGDSFLLMKFFNQDGIRKQYVLLSLRNLDEQVKRAEQLTVEEIINYCKNSKLEKLRH